MKFGGNSAKFGQTSPFRDRVAELRGPSEGLVRASCARELLSKLAVFHLLLIAAFWELGTL